MKLHWQQFLEIRKVKPRGLGSIHDCL